jgi:hypothetical protein
MRVTGATLNEKSEYWAQVERLGHSRTLHGSESLCKLLRYLAKHALDQDGIHLKEYQIASIRNSIPSLGTGRQAPNQAC